MPKAYIRPLSERQRASQAQGTQEPEYTGPLSERQRASRAQGAGNTGTGVYCSTRGFRVPRNAEIGLRSKFWKRSHVHEDDKSTPQRRDRFAQ